MEEKVNNMEEKVNNIVINLTSLVDYIRDKDLEIETWRLKHLKEFKENKRLQEQLNKQEEVLDKIKEILKTDGIVEDIYYALCMLFKFEGYDDETMINQKLRNILKGDE